MKLTFQSCGSMCNTGRKLMKHSDPKRLGKCGSLAKVYRKGSVDNHEISSRVGFLMCTKLRGDFSGVNYRKINCMLFSSFASFFLSFFFLVKQPCACMLWWTLQLLVQKSLFHCLGCPFLTLKSDEELATRKHKKNETVLLLRHKFLLMIIIK